MTDIDNNSRGRTDRGKVSYVDVIMGFSVMATLLLVAPFLFQVIGILQSETDPLTGVLLALVVPFIFISLFLSMGVSARSQ